MRVTVGSTVAVVGCGGIGLAAVQGARVAGASRIVAVDRSTEKLAAACGSGATDTALSGDRVEAGVRDLVPSRFVTGTPEPSTLQQQGRLRLEETISHRFDFADSNEAFRVHAGADMPAGTAG